MKNFTLLLFLSFAAILKAQTESAGFKTDKKEDKKLERLKEKHSQWERIIIINNGDTVSVRIKPKEEYSKVKSQGVLDAFHDFNDFTIAFDNEKEKHIYPSDFSSMIIPSQGKFVSLKVTEGGEIKHKLFKVLVDGACQLLFMEYAEAYSAVDANEYYVYYDSSIWLLKDEERNKGLIPIKEKDTTHKFRKTCGEIFSSCPALIQNIEAKNLGLKDLPEIVSEFNHCLGGK